MIVFGAWHVMTTTRGRKNAKGRNNEIWQIQRQKEWKSPLELPHSYSLETVLVRVDLVSITMDASIYAMSHQ